MHHHKISGYPGKRRLTPVWLLVPVCGIILLLAGCQHSASPNAQSVTGPLVQENASQPDQPDTPAADNRTTRDIRFKTSDGITLMTKAGGLLDTPRPVIVEFSPYDPACCTRYGGDDYNYLQVHIRGTGDSDDAFDALGPRSQKDVQEVLEWLCGDNPDHPKPEWSNGKVGLYGFSASAIMLYNSLHLKLPSCVNAAVLMAGTKSLYRDLMYPGGIPNIAPGLVVDVTIGAPGITELPSRLQRNPLTSVIYPFLSYFGVGLNFLLHPTLDSWWQKRGMRGNVNHIPTLLLTSFFDVQPRGPFLAFREFKRQGIPTHLLAFAAHDNPPGDNDIRPATQKAWYDHFLRGKNTGVKQQPAVDLYFAKGDRLDYIRGQDDELTGSDWPLPGTQWSTLYLNPQTSDSNAISLNNGSLTLAPADATAKQSYTALISIPTESDNNTTSTGLGGDPDQPSANMLFSYLPFLVNMNLMETLSLTYTSAPLQHDVAAVGPASLKLKLSTLLPGSDIYALITDVWPDGTSHPIATGRLRTDFPNINRAKSLTDADGDIVEPFNIFSHKDPATPLKMRTYYVEFWPLGNLFQKGHRIRVDLTSVSAYHLPGSPSINTVLVGGKEGAKLLLPVAPGNNLQTALEPGND